MPGLCHSHAVTLLSSLQKKPSHTLSLLFLPLLQLHTTLDYVSKQSEPQGPQQKLVQCMLEGN